MRKLIVFLSLIFIPFFIFLSTSSIFSKQAIHRGMEALAYPVPAQDTEQEGKEGKEDPYSIMLLKQIREKVDTWLKSLNEKIEREDVTRLEVRFYEFLRNILEWVKRKLDTKIESLEEKKSQKKEKEVLSQETLQGIFLRFKIG